MRMPFLHEKFWFSFLYNYILFSLYFFLFKKSVNIFLVRSLWLLYPLHLLYHIRLSWQCYKNMQNHQMFVNHSSQVSAITSKVTLMSVYLLRLYPKSPGIKSREGRWYPFKATSVSSKQGSCTNHTLGIFFPSPATGGINFGATCVA